MDFNKVAVAAVNASYISPRTLSTRVCPKAVCAGWLHSSPLRCTMPCSSSCLLFLLQAGEIVDDDLNRCLINPLPTVRRCWLLPSRVLPLPPLLLVLRRCVANWRQPASPGACRLSCGSRIPDSLDCVCHWALLGPRTDAPTPYY